MSRVTSSRDRRTFIQLVLSAVSVSFLIHVWKLSGCVGFSQCQLCQSFTPDSFLTNTHVNSSDDDDFFRLMNLKNFTFLMNTRACNDSDMPLLILVHSNPYNWEKRLTIRRTWAGIVRDDFKLLFLLGTPNSTVVQNLLVEESKANGDLVQGNFVDSYRNLTYKHVMALKWTKYFCPGAKYLLKTDDDVFVNLPKFLFYVKRDAPRSKLMLCAPVYDARVKRTSRSKWRTKLSEYEFRFFPAYCHGFAVLYSFDVVSTLYGYAQKAKYFWIDDVFITGMLAAAANIIPSNFGDLLLWHDRYYKLLRQGLVEYTYLLGPYNLQVVDMKKLWEWVS